MLELLVLLTCIGEYRCDKTLPAYLAHNVELKQQIKLQNRRVQRIVGKENMVLIGTTYKAFYGNKVKLKLPHNLLLEVPLKEGEQKLYLSWRVDF